MRLANDCEMCLCVTVENHAHFWQADRYVRGAKRKHRANAVSEVIDGVESLIYREILRLLGSSERSQAISKRVILAGSRHVRKEGSAPFGTIVARLNNHTCFYVKGRR